MVSSLPAIVRILASSLIFGVEKELHTVSCDVEARLDVVEAGVRPAVGVAVLVVLAPQPEASQAKKTMARRLI